MESTYLMRKSRSKLVTETGNIGKNAQFIIDQLNRELVRLKHEARQESQAWIAIMLMISTDQKEAAMQAIAEVIRAKADSQDSHDFASDIANYLANEKFMEAIDAINQHVQRKLKQ